MRKHLLTIGLMAGLLAGSLTAMAVPPAPAPHHPGPGPMMGCPMMKDVESLSPEKKAAFEADIKALRDQLRPKVSMLRAKEMMLNADLMQPSVNKGEVNTLMKEINDLRSQILQAQVDSVMKIKADTGISLPVMPMGPMMMGMGMHRMQMQGCHMMPMPPQGPQSMPMQKK